jgi:hypothetical protein
MTLTQERLKQIIKEELEALMSETETETDPEVAALEATIAEAKKKLAAKAMSGKRGMKGKVANTGKMTTVKPKINGNAGKTGKVKK